MSSFVSWGNSSFRWQTDSSSDPSESKKAEQKKTDEKKQQDVEQAIETAKSRLVTQENQQVNYTTSLFSTTSREIDNVAGVELQHYYQQDTQSQSTISAKA